MMQTEVAVSLLHESRPLGALLGLLVLNTGINTLFKSDIVISGSNTLGLKWQLRLPESLQMEMIRSSSLCIALPKSHLQRVKVFERC